MGNVTFRLACRFGCLPAQKRRVARPGNPVPLGKSSPQVAAVTVRRPGACPDDRVLLYKVTRKLLSPPSSLFRGDTAKDAELLVLRHENAVLHRQPAAPVRYERVDRSWFAALSGLIPRCRRVEVLPEAER